jgi:hypothetical protein
VCSEGHTAVGVVMTTSDAGICPHQIKISCLALMSSIGRPVIMNALFNASTKGEYSKDSTPIPTRKRVLPEVPVP